jgi:hypothetical protein
MNTETDKATKPGSRRWFAGWLTMLALIATCVAVWNAVHAIDPPISATAVIAWPALIHPAWAGLVVSILALGVTSQIYRWQTRKDQQTAEVGKVWICTQCDAGGWPGSALTAKDHRNTGHLIRSGGPEVLAGYRPSGLSTGPDEFLDHPETGTRRTRPER